MATNNNEEKFIAAIEIGSSKITGMIGRRLPDSSVQVLAFAQEDASTFIRRGVVYNVDKTSECLKNIRIKLEDATKKTIAKVYVCIGGQSLHSIAYSVTRDFDIETKITQQLIEELYEEDRKQEEPSCLLTKIIPLGCYTGKQRRPADESALAGIVTDKIELGFLNIYYRRHFYELIKECFTRAGFRKMEFLMSPIVLGDTHIGIDAKRTGCVLVDIGKDTTSVAVYSSKLLKRLAVIPLGSGNITKDIATEFRIEEYEAEKLKTQYSSVFIDHENPESEEARNYSLQDGRDIDGRRLDEIAEARFEEIVANVCEQINRSGVKLGDELISGIVLTGGGANMRGVEAAFRNYTKSPGLKISIVKSPNFQVNTKIPDVKRTDATLNTILAILSQCNDDCAGEDIRDPQIFDPEVNDDTKNAGDESTNTNIDGLNPKADEPTEKPEPQKPGMFKKLRDKVKHGLDILLSPENE